MTARNTTLNNDCVPTGTESMDYSNGNVHKLSSPTPVFPYAHTPLRNGEGKTTAAAAPIDPRRLFIHANDNTKHIPDRQKQTQYTNQPTRPASPTSTQTIQNSLMDWNDVTGTNDISSSSDRIDLSIDKNASFFRGSLPPSSEGSWLSDPSGPVVICTSCEIASAVRLTQRDNRPWTVNVFLEHGDDTDRKANIIESFRQALLTSARDAAMRIQTAILAQDQLNRSPYVILTHGDGPSNIKRSPRGIEPDSPSSKRRRLCIEPVSSTSHPILIRRPSGPESCSLCICDFRPNYWNPPPEDGARPHPITVHPILGPISSTLSFKDSSAYKFWDKDREPAARHSQLKR
jgi:hypothetical protein